MFFYKFFYAQESGQKSALAKPGMETCFATEHKKICKKTLRTS